MIEKLNKKEMNRVKGGIDADQYCATLDVLMTYNWDNWTPAEKEAAVNAWFEHCG